MVIMEKDYFKNIDSWPRKKLIFFIKQLLDQNDRLGKILTCASDVYLDETGVHCAKCNEILDMTFPKKHSCAKK